MINRSVKYLSKISNKKYQPFSLKTVRWTNGECLNYRDLMKIYYRANGYDIEPVVERDSETGLPMLFEYGLPAKNKQGKDYKIPVNIFYDAKAAYNTAAFAFQEEGRTKEEIIYGMLYRIINMGITNETESKKLEKADHDKVSFVFLLGDIIIGKNSEGKDVYGLPIRYEVRDRK